jgi:hypothetical protein
MTHYLKVNYSNGAIQESSKEPQEGFEKNEWSVGNKSGVNYKKIYREPVEGTLVDVKFRDTQYGQRVSFTLKGDEYYNIEFPFLMGEEVNPFTTDFVRQLPNLQRGRTYTVSAYVYQPENAKYPYRGFTFRVDGEKVEKALSYQSSKNEDGDIPSIVWEEKMGKKKPNFDNRNEYLYNFLQKHIGENFSKDENASTPEPTKTEVRKPSIEDLPF